MNTRTTFATTRAPTQGRLFQRLARSAVLTRLQGVRGARLEITDPLGVSDLGDPSGPKVAVTVHDLRFYATVVSRGGLAAGEGYANGLWDTEDLAGVVRILLRNRPVLDALNGGAARVSGALLRGLLALRSSSRSKSKADITFHYDLGNEFFELLLDETMTYSSGVFPTPDVSLAEASTEKYDRICRKLALTSDHHVLEIGCGWGGFAAHAARHYGCRVTGTTISPAQRTYAIERMARAGLADRVTILDQDYRDLRGQFDRVVSIEMIEAVGHEGMGRLFGVMGERLAHDGLALIQSITISDQAYDRARRTMDFIKQHIFPGSCIPSVTAMTRAATERSDLRMTHLEDIGLHYAETLRRWDANMLRHADAIRAQGFDDRFLRLWHYYFCYCEAGFEERYLGNVQMLFAKPGSRALPPLLPATTRHFACD